MAPEPIESLPEGVDPYYYATWDWRTGKLHVPARYDHPDTWLAEVVGVYEDWREAATAKLAKDGYTTHGEWRDNPGFENSTILLRR